MSISKETVEHVAELSRLSFSEEELEMMTSQLGNIINMVEKLEEVDTTGIDVTTNVIHDMNLYRNDEVGHVDSRDELMKNVPVHEDGYIKVPAMLANGEEDA